LTVASAQFQPQFQITGTIEFKISTTIARQRTVWGTRTFFKRETTGKKARSPNDHDVCGRAILSEGFRITNVGKAGTTIARLNTRWLTGTIFKLELTLTIREAAITLLHAIGCREGIEGTTELGEVSAASAGIQTIELAGTSGGRGASTDSQTRFSGVLQWFA